jgi:hypothetical protein
METKGYRVVQSQTITGLHDYEQYYCDLLRKMILRVHKSPHTGPYLLERCLSSLSRDTDFLVAGLGFVLGLETSASKDDLDARTWQSHARAALDSHGIKEKDPIPLEEYAGFVEKTIAEYVPPQMYRTFADAQLSPRGVKTMPSPEPLSLKYITWWTGNALGYVGRLLIEWATRQRLTEGGFSDD